MMKGASRPGLPMHAKRAGSSAGGCLAFLGALGVALLLYLAGRELQWGYGRIAI
jgi:hypothetical protein